MRQRNEILLRKVSVPRASLTRSRGSPLFEGAFLRLTGWFLSGISRFFSFIGGRRGGASWAPPPTGGGANIAVENPVHRRGAFHMPPLSAGACPPASRVAKRKFRTAGGETRTPAENRFCSLRADMSCRRQPPPPAESGVNTGRVLPVCSVFF